MRLDRTDLIFYLSILQATEETGAWTVPLVKVNQDADILGFCNFKINLQRTN